MANNLIFHLKELLTDQSAQWTIIKIITAWSAFV